MPLTQEKLKRLLNYDPETGIWTYVEAPPRKPWMKGFRAGCFKASTGYWYIKIDGNDYQSSRLAFLYMLGEWPTNQVDHINRIRHDDRWTNLRKATCSQNRVNEASRGNMTGHKGVRFDPRYKAPYIARAHVDGCTIYLGSFATAEEAHAAWYKAACEDHGEEFVEAG